MIKYLLCPFSWLYGFITDARNYLYDKGLFKSKSFEIPIINVGNITVGGTGKSPQVEYLIKLLKDKSFVNFEEGRNALDVVLAILIPSGIIKEIAISIGTGTKTV